MKCRYRIEHHPNLMTQLLVEFEDGKTVKVFSHSTWGETREYCRANLEHLGVKPVIETPEPYVETFPWVDNQAETNEELQEPNQPPPQRRSSARHDSAAGHALHVGAEYGSASSGNH